jgi:glycosyltransferase involved in cell wall biosynthesis
LARTVLFLHSSAGRYGADLQLLALAGGLDRARFRAFAVLPERGELASLLEDAGVEVEVRRLAVLRRMLLSPRGMGALAVRLASDRGALARLARERGAALVHSNTSVILSGQAAARGAGAGHVMHVREIYAGAGAVALWPLQRRRILRAEAVACISEAVAAQFPAAPNVTVLRDGLPRTPGRAERAAARAALGLREDAFSVALIGRVSDWKGQDVLARALAEPALTQIGAAGLVAGAPFPGNERVETELRRLRDDLGLGERLSLLGFREDLATVLGAADAVAVPSKRPEPLGLVALEAGAVGLPVVASAAGGLAEAVLDGKTGLLVPPGDHRALAAALRRLADDPQLANRLGQAAVRHVRERFSHERMVREVEELYERLLERAGGTAA